MYNLTDFNTPPWMNCCRYARIWERKRRIGCPTYEDFLAVGTKAKISPTRCRELYEQVRENLVNL